MALDREYGRNTPDLEGSRKRKSTPQPHESKRIKPENDEVEEEDETPDQIAKQYKKYEYAPKYNLNSEELFCICRRPDSGELMIMCDGCEEWFHFKCMKINKLYSNLIAKFYCKFCKWKDLGDSQWKRKCRLEYCYEPIRPDSKYCCDEHGKEYMKQQLIERERNRNDVSINIINDILIHVDDNYDKLMELGNKFPELQQVTQFKQDGSGSIPDNLKQKLNSINDRLNIVEKSIESYNSRVKNLVKIKDKIKSINDKLSNQIEDENNKKKPKKIDICCYDRNLESSNDIALIESLEQNDDNENFLQFKQIIQDRVNDPEEDSDDWFEDRICTIDRKRCIRHNGWWGLINDEFTKKLNQLDLDLEILQQEKEDVFKDYSIKIYETKEIKQDIKVAMNDDIKDEIKVDAKDDTKEDAKDDIKVDAKDDIKVDAKEDVKDDKKEKVSQEVGLEIDSNNLEANKETNQDANQETNQETNQDINQETNVETNQENLQKDS